MKRFTEKELWDFVNRAESIEQIHTADNFLSKLDYLDIDVYCEMMDALAYKEREYHRARREAEKQSTTDKYGIWHLHG